MPTYLCHGFRWHRRAIRIYVILNDLEDAASNWIIGPATSSSIVSQFYTSYDFLPEVAPPQQDESVSIKAKKDNEHLDDDLSLPPSRVAPENDGVLMHLWSAVKLLEEYDPEETVTPCRPYAYVADHVVRIDLSADVAGEMAKYYEKMAGEDGWIVKLRDELQKGEPVRWYVVVCGDEVRDFPGMSDDEESEEDSTSEYGGEGDDTLTVLDKVPEEQEGRSTPRPHEHKWPDIRQPIQPSEPLPQRLSTSTSSSRWSQDDAAAPPRLTPDIQMPLLRTFDSVSSRYSTSTASGLYHDGDRLLLEPEEFVMAQSPARTPLREEAPDIVMPIRAEELNPSLSAWSTTPSPQHAELPDPGSHPYAEIMPSRSPSPMSPATVRQEMAGPVEVREPEKTQPHQAPSPMTQSSPWQQLLGSRLQHSDDSSSSGRSSPIAPQKGGPEMLHDPRDFQSSQTPSPTSPNPPRLGTTRPSDNAQDTRPSETPSPTSPNPPMSNMTRSLHDPQETQSSLIPAPLSPKPLQPGLKSSLINLQHLQPSRTPSPTSPNPPMSNMTRSLHDPQETQSSLIPAPLSPKPLQPGLKSSLINLQHLQPSRTPSPTSPTSLDSPQSNLARPLINPRSLQPSETPSPTSPNPPTRSLINPQDLQPSRTPSPPSPTSLGPSQTRSLINPQELRSQTPSPTSPTSPTSLGASQTRSLINPQDLRSSETPSPTSPSPLPPTITRSLVNPQELQPSRTPSPTSRNPPTRSLINSHDLQPSRTPSPTSRGPPQLEITRSSVNPQDLQPSQTPSPTSPNPIRPVSARPLVNRQDLRASQTPSPTSPEPLQPVSTKPHIDAHYLRASETPSPTSPSPLPPGPRTPEKPQNTRYSETPSPTSPNPPQQGVARGLNPADIQPSQTPSPTSPYPPQASSQPLEYFQNQYSRTPSPPSPNLSHGLLGSSFHSAQGQPRTPLSTSPNPAGQGLLGSALPRPGETLLPRTPTPMSLNPPEQDLPTPDISQMPGALPLSPSTPIRDPFETAEAYGAQERDVVSRPSTHLSTPTLVQKKTPDRHTVDHSAESLLRSSSPASPVRRPQETPILGVPPPPEPVEVIRVPPPTPPKARSVQEEEIGTMPRSEPGEPSWAGATIRAPPPAPMAAWSEMSSFVDELENEETVWEPRPSPASNHGWDRGPQRTPLGNGEGRAPPVPPPPPPTQFETRQVSVSTQHTGVHKPEGEQQPRQARRRHSVADGLKRLFRKGHSQGGSH